MATSEPSTGRCLTEKAAAAEEEGEEEKKQWEE
jgi:hypothetical protein